MAWAGRGHWRPRPRVQPQGVGWGRRERDESGFGGCFCVQAPCVVRGTGWVRARTARGPATSQLVAGSRPSAAPTPRERAPWGSRRPRVGPGGLPSQLGPGSVPAAGALGEGTSSGWRGRCLLLFAAERGSVSRLCRWPLGRPLPVQALGCGSLSVGPACLPPPVPSWFPLPAALPSPGCGAAPGRHPVQGSAGAGLGVSPTRGATWAWVPRSGRPRTAWSLFPSVQPAVGTCQFTECAWTSCPLSGVTVGSELPWWGPGCGGAG